jgi:hypothetical protein
MGDAQYIPKPKLPRAYIRYLRNILVSGSSKSPFIVPINHQEDWSISRGTRNNFTRLTTLTAAISNVLQISVFVINNRSREERN